ncbi:MAG TPA: hypothetical protein VG497_28115 [Kribbella sp.]|nr:hypothetical protein [Kribbella sp.]
MNGFWTKAIAWARTAPGRYRKALAGLWGYLTVPVVVLIAHLAGWDMGADTALLVIGIGSAVLGTGAVAVVKPNDNVRPALAVDPLIAEDVNRGPAAPPAPPKQ